MLRAMRDGAKSGFLKYVLLGFLVLAAGGLVLTDVGGFFRAGVSNGAVAQGKGIEISTVQFDRTVRRILARQGMNPQEAYNLGLINQILDSELQILMLTREARDLGLNVSDDVVMKQLEKIAEPLAQDGVSKKEALQQVLRSQGISEGEFVQAVRQEMATNIFRSAIVNNASTISKSQATDLYQYQNEMRDLKGFTLTNKNADLVQKPTNENLQKYYESNKMDYLISEKRDITIATLKKEALEDKVEITDKDLQEVYEDNIEAYARPERRNLEQAILDIQTDAQEIVKKLNKGASLKNAVKTVTGNATPYLGENNFEEGGLLEGISDPVFKANKGDVIGPVQTALGWHVLVLKDISKPQTESFESVKKSLRDEMLQERLMEDLVEAANMLDDRLASGEELEAVVDDMGLTTENYISFNQAGLNAKGKDLFAAYQGDRAPILESAFDFIEGESSPVMELSDGRFITVRVDHIQEKSYRPFDSVKTKLKTKWETTQRALANKQRAEEALAALNIGESLADVAKKYGATISNFKDLKRAQTPKAPITLPALRQAFDAKKNTPLKLAVPDGYVIAQVTDISLPNTDKAEKEITALMEQTKEVLPQETIAQYINNLANKYKVKINERALKQIYGTPQ